MKTFLFALFFLSSFTSSLPSSATAEVVVDASGKPLRNGGLYYIVPCLWLFGGGLELAPTGNETCPLSVVQSPFEVNRGKPLRISSRLRITTIRTSDYLEIAFNEVPTCAPRPSAWTVVEGVPDEGIPWGQVKITGTEGIDSYSFKIESEPFEALCRLPQYRIIYYPSDSIVAPGVISVYHDDNGIRRVVSNQIAPAPVTTLKVVFIEVKNGLSSAE